MPSLFAPATDSILRAVLLILVLTVVAIPTSLMAWVRSPLATGQGHTEEQPIFFDHRHHVQDAQIDCEYCHYLARRSPQAGVPETALCAGCHLQIHSGEAHVAPILASLEENRPIRWRRVHDLPDFVFFDHAVHRAAGVGCESCHGRVDEMASVRQSAPLSMGFCLDCHENPRPHLRPVSAITVMGYEPSLSDQALPDVSPPLHCSGCHR